jgi:hypothetical protein
MSGNISGREYNKFVQSPTRSDGSAVEITGQVSITDSIATSIQPVITNETLALSNTEYEITLPTDAMSFSLKSRELSRLKIGFAAGSTTTTYFTVSLGGYFHCDQKINVNKIYVSTDRDNTLLEILTYQMV